MKNIQKGSTAIFFSAAMIASILVLMSPAQAWDAEFADELAFRYAPNMWFDSEEECYPCSPFFYTDEIKQTSGERSKNEYLSLNQSQKMDNLTIYYHTVDTGEEEVYEYWFYYAYNDFANKHYHDWETVYVFVDKSTEEVTRVVASAHEWWCPDNEYFNPQFAEEEHAGILIEKGSHASCIDRNNNGLFERETDVTNGYIPYTSIWFAWGIGLWPSWVWNEEDQLNGYRITCGEIIFYLQMNFGSDQPSPYYNLKEITSDFISKFGGSDTFPNSPAYYSIPIKVPIIGGTALVELCGYSPKHPWVQDRYDNPEAIIPELTDFIVGTVSGSDTTGAIVVILSEEPYYTFADENGNFRLNNIPYGVYDVVVNLEGYAPYKQSFMHEGNTSLGVNGTLHIIPESEAFRIEGIAIDVEGNIVPHATITAYDENGIMLFTTLTDENGTYLVTASAEHVYTVEATFGNKTEKFYNVSGEAGDVINIDLLVTNPRLLKEDGISELESIDANKPAQKLIHDSIWFINHSLDERLWADATHLNSTGMKGVLIFDNEKVAVLKLEAAMKIDHTVKEEIKSVTEKLVDADRQIAIVAINDAENIVVENALKKKIVTREIARAEEEKQKAEGYLHKDMPAIAIGHFKLAWIHAQTAIKIAQEVPKG